jgi:osmotically-inducible protein OsmY
VADEEQRCVVRRNAAVLHESSASIAQPGQRMRSDDDIKRYVEDELKWDPNVDPTDIRVAVSS